MNAGARQTKGGSQRWETQIDTERRDGQPVIRAGRNRGLRETGRRGDDGETQNRKPVGTDCEPEGQGQGAGAQTTLESRGIFKPSLTSPSSDLKERAAGRS